MKEYTQEELNKILSDHKDWLYGKGRGSRADLHGADLHCADLHGAYLHGADLHGADLRDADLRGANLRDAYLHCADLRGANLHCADLRGANLHCADLHGANLRDAYLHGADLHGADLRGANLDYAVWPLWCGGLHVKIDDRIARQLAYHFCAQECDSPDYQKTREAILSYANGFHRTKECGLLTRGA